VQAINKKRRASDSEAGIAQWRCFSTAIRSRQAFSKPR